MGKKTNHFGKILWSDLTVENAEEIKNFYKEVVGWDEKHVPMKDGEEDYVDYGMGCNEEGVAGICHKRGRNRAIPSQWIMYIQVEDVAHSLNKVLELGGKLIHEARKKDGSYFYVIVEDPAGAVFGLGNFNA
ncbi:MAG TPA: VOC family protein [Faecalibacter sp.]